MLTIEELKKQIENKTVQTSHVFIVKDEDNFIAHQYIEEIARIHNLEIKTVDYLPKKNSLVKTKSTYLMVYHCDEYKEVAPTDCIVVAKKGNGVEFPKCEVWMLKDYVSSQLPGIPDIESICDSITDPYRVQNEIEKLKLFPPEAQKKLFKEMKQKGLYNLQGYKTAIDLANALLTFDNNALIDILRNKDLCDLTDMFLLITLHNTYSKLLKIKSLSNVTADSVGLKSPAQLAFYKKMAALYSGKAVFDIFTFLNQTDFDYRGKGCFGDKIDFVDYLTMQILLRRGER